MPWQHCYPIGSVAVETENELASCRATRLRAAPVLQLCVAHVLLSFLSLSLSLTRSLSLPLSPRRFLCLSASLGFQ